MRKELQTCERNYGIDALRIISMIMIVILHIMGHGGILKSLPYMTNGHYSVWILETAAYGAVNTYALISGYVGISSKFKYSGIINLLFSVVFYSLGFSLVFYITSPETVTPQDLLQAVFPYAFNTYWYFTAYFCMYFFIPYFNHLINSLNQFNASKLVFSLVLITSVIPTVFQVDMAITKNGYSALWLSVLYIIGAYIRKYNIGNKAKKHMLLLIYLCCVTVNCLSKFAAEYSSQNILYKAINSNFLISYCSPTVLLASAALLILFSKISFENKSRKIISFFTPLTFGVYLIHDFPLIRNNYIVDKFINLTSYSSPIMIPLIIVSAISVWFVCSLADKLRAELFKLIKIKLLSEKIFILFAKLVSVLFKSVENQTDGNND